MEEKCSFTSITHCLCADDALYLGSSYFGTFPTLTYDTWRFRLPGSNITVTLAVSSDSCVPVVEGTSDPATRKSSLNVIWNKIFSTELSSESPSIRVFSISDWMEFGRKCYLLLVTNKLNDVFAVRCPLGPASANDTRTSKCLPLAGC